MEFSMKLMKNVLCGVLLSSVVAGAVYGDDFSFNTKSLFGIEAGYTSFTVDNNLAEINPTIPVDPTTSYSKPDIGLKLGAQGDDFRVFFSARNYFVGSEYDYFVTLGAEAQYLFNFSKSANFFLGVNGGYLAGKYRPDDLNYALEFSDMYYGGDLGFNFHINQAYDLEIGARVMATNASDGSGAVTYSIDYLASGYASFIIKFTMD
jgi:hypothetical protein